MDASDGFTAAAGAMKVFFIERLPLGLSFTHKLIEKKFDNLFYNNFFTKNLQIN